MSYLLDCRQCLEVQCRDGTFKDYFGNEYERSGICKGAPGSVSVKVKIVDTCDQVIVTLALGTLNEPRFAFGFG